MASAYDVLVLTPSRPLTAAQQPSSGLVAGAPRLAQKVALQLLTERGSLRYLASAGCELIKEARNGLAGELDALAAINAGLLDSLAYLIAEETDADPPEDRLAKVEVTRLTVAPGSVTATLEVITKAGDGGGVTFPVTWEAS